MCVSRKCHTQHIPTTLLTLLYIRPFVLLAGMPRILLWVQLCYPDPGLQNMVPWVGRNMGGKWTHQCLEPKWPEAKAGWLTSTFTPLSLQHVMLLHDSATLNISPLPPVYQTFCSVGRNVAHPVMGLALLPGPRTVPSTLRPAPSLPSCTWCAWGMRRAGRRWAWCGWWGGAVAGFWKTLGTFCLGGKDGTFGVEPLVFSKFFAKSPSARSTPCPRMLQAPKTLCNFPPPLVFIMNSEFDTGRPTKSAAASQSCSMSGSGRASVGFMDWARCSKARSSCFATWMDLCQAIKLAQRSVLHVVKEDARPNSWIRHGSIWDCAIWRAPDTLALWPVKALAPFWWVVLIPNLSAMLRKVSAHPALVVLFPAASWTLNMLQRPQRSWPRWVLFQRREGTACGCDPEPS